MSRAIDKFSLWVDFIERDFIQNDLAKLIVKHDLGGATSNPAIFKDAILKSLAYKDQLKTVEHLSAKEKYEALAIEDIRAAADLFKEIYRQSGSSDGFVSIEVDPMLCDDAKATVDEGRRLFKAIDRDNVMIKIPATKAGFEAMFELSKLSIPINATLIFSKEQALSCLDAFKRAKEQSGKSVSSVISVFVSRFDRKLDPMLKQHSIAPALTGIYNASAIYSAVNRDGFSECRVLFASTGVKDDSLEPSYYIEALLAAHSVNTAPLHSIESFTEKKSIDALLPIDSSTIEQHFAKLKEVGIDMREIEDELMRDATAAFKVAFRQILDELE